MVPSGSLLIDQDEERSDFIIMFSPAPNRIAGKWQEMQMQFGRSWIDSCYQGFELSSDVAKALQEYFDSVFAWSPGEYKAQFVFRVDDQLQEQRYSYTLSEGQSDRLKAMRLKIARCAGMMVFPNQLPSLSYSDAASENFVEVLIEGDS